MQQEDVDHEIREDDDQRKDEIVVEISLPDRIVLRDLSLLGEEDDEDQDDGRQK